MTTCPIPTCNGNLYVSCTICSPFDDPRSAVSSGWEVVCDEGHTVWTHVDQIRVDNAAGRTDDDETGDYAPPFRPEAMSDAG